MEKALCDTCQSAKTTLRCGLCAAPSCKTCAHLMDEDAFSFLPKVPPELTKGVYCNTCYQDKVAGAVESYEKTMKTAGQVDVYFSDQGKETRLMKREAPPYVLKDCADHDELVLRFAFLAVLDGFSMIIDVDIIGDKVREGSYQRTVFRGTATPAHARPNQVPRDKSIRHNPN